VARDFFSSVEVYKPNGWRKQSSFSWILKNFQTGFLWKISGDFADRGFNPLIFLLIPRGLFPFAREPPLGTH